MKGMLKSGSPNEQGYTLVEVVSVAAIIGIILAMASIYGKPTIDKYNAESQIRKMCTDLLQARMKAMEKNRQYFVTVNTGNYQVIEDANENGVNDDAVTLQATLKYVISGGSGTSGGTGTVTMDQRGLITSADTYTTIQFSTGSALQADYDCIVMYPTRINIGSTNGTNCIPR
jgi:prepilin-type N-terminal cleavage/methylation domain-containing protein